MERIASLTCVIILTLASASSLPREGSEGRITALLNPPPKQPRISNGTSAKDGEFPYQVAIVATGTPTLRCGGALIKKNFVLTSAYCAAIGPATDIQVVVGNIKMATENPSQFVDVERIWIHEDYNTDGRKNDVALLQLKSSLTIQTNVDIIPLRSSAQIDVENCTFSGWGATTWNGQPSSVLQKVDVVIVSKTGCTTQLGQTIQVDQICAGSPVTSTAACFLDEGGPLVCKGELSGILSSSVNCGKEGKPSIFSEVAYHKDWIEKIINTAPVNTLSCFMIIAMFAAIMSFWNSRV